MALRDAKIYYYKMLAQYVESKEDLADFEQAFAEGNITEDKLQYVKEDLGAIKANLDRIQYIFYLLSVPNRKEKKSRFFKANRTLEEYFKRIGVDTKSIEDENTETLTHLRAELEKLKKDEK